MVGGHDHSLQILDGGHEARLVVVSGSATKVSGVTSIDGWLERLDEHGMIMSRSTGTTGKLSFLPRSGDEWPAWQSAWFEALRLATGVDFRTEAVPLFYPGYRDGHTTGTKMQRMFSELSAAGEEGRHCLYEYKISSDLLSLAARLRTAEERGELEKLDIDPKLLEERAKLIAGQTAFAVGFQRDGLQGGAGGIFARWQ